MITLTQALEDIIKRNPFLEEALCAGIINLSALGRTLKPQLKKTLYKSPTDAAMIMALKRLSVTLKKKQPQGFKELKKLQHLNLRSHLIEYVLSNVPSVMGLHKQLVEQMNHSQELFVNLSQGVSDTTLIVSQSLEAKIDRIIPKKMVVQKISNLASITLRLQPSHVAVPGVLYALFKSLAWEHINVVETISGYSDITIIVNQADSDRALSCIRSVTEVS